VLCPTCQNQVKVDEFADHVALKCTLRDEYLDDGVAPVDRDDEFAGDIGGRGSGT
jgi:hypothetical protein